MDRVRPTFSSRVDSVHATAHVHIPMKWQSTSSTSNTIATTPSRVMTTFTSLITANGTFSFINVSIMYHTEHTTHTPLWHITSILSLWIKFSTCVFSYTDYFDLHLVTFDLILYMRWTVGSWQNHVDCACPCIPPASNFKRADPFSRNFVWTLKYWRSAQHRTFYLPTISSKSIFFPLAQQPLVGQGLISRLQNHTQAHNTR